MTYQGTDLFVIPDMPDSQLQSPEKSERKYMASKIAPIDALIVKKNNSVFNIEEINKRSAL